MLVKFGLHRGTLDPAPPRNCLGEVTVNPLGLLSILETDLGLPPVLAHPAEQLIAYRGCLADLDSPERFYHRSFDVDPVNVARTLMTWRAQWYEAGVLEPEQPSGIGDSEQVGVQAVVGKTVE